jgi:hypothetical protein
VGQHISLVLADEKYAKDPGLFIRRCVAIVYVATQNRLLYMSGQNNRFYRGERRRLSQSQSPTDVAMVGKDKRMRVFSIKVSELLVAQRKLYVVILHDISIIPSLSSSSRLAYNRYTEERSRYSLGPGREMMTPDPFAVMESPRGVKDDHEEGESLVSGMGAGLPLRLQLTNKGDRIDNRDSTYGKGSSLGSTGQSSSLENSLDRSEKSP